jgi:hypothetical protein
MFRRNILALILICKHASFRADAHSCLLLAFSLHVITFSTPKSFSTSVSHLSLDFRALLLSVGLLMLSTRIWFTVVTHRSRFLNVRYHINGLYNNVTIVGCLNEAKLVVSACSTHGEMINAYEI